MGDCDDVCQTCFKIFILLILLGPLIVASLVLFGIAILGDILVILYFFLCGWCSEIQLCDCGGCCRPFLVKGLTTPWKPICLLFYKLCEFLNKDLFKEIEGTDVRIAYNGQYSAR